MYKVDLQPVDALYNQVQASLNAGNYAGVMRQTGTNQISAVVSHYNRSVPAFAIRGAQVIELRGAAVLADSYDDELDRAQAYLETARLAVDLTKDGIEYHGETPPRTNEEREQLHLERAEACVRAAQAMVRLAVADPEQLQDRRLRRKNLISKAAKLLVVSEDNFGRTTAPLERAEARVTRARLEALHSWVGIKKYWHVLTIGTLAAGEFLHGHGKNAGIIWKMTRDTAQQVFSRHGEFGTEAVIKAAPYGHYVKPRAKIVQAHMPMEV